MGVLRSLRRMKPQAKIGIEVLRRKIENDPMLANRVVCRTKAGQEKMSDVIAEFAKPILENIEGNGRMQLLLMFAMACWNAALVPDEKRGRIVNEVVDMYVADDITMRPYFLNLAQMLLERKKQLFADVKRLVITWEFVEQGDSFQLLVASTDIKAVESN